VTAEPGVFIRAECLKCGLCCMETEMVLLPEDISVIVELGYQVQDFAVWSEGYWRLKNVDGHCYFYDPAEGTCKIYRYRPLGCRIYPIIYVEGVGPAVDDVCPLSDTITSEEWRTGLKLLKKYLRLLKRHYRMSKR